MRNVEAKFKLTDRRRMLERALEIGFAHSGELSQRDTFFVTASGKLKLREEPGGAHLIHYARQSASGLGLSDYEIVPVIEPERIRTILSAALGAHAEVRKRRVVMIRQNVRLHIDSVESLGEFGELEAVLVEGESEQANRKRLSDLLEQLGVEAEALIEASYFELMKVR
jgi:predicted adenylyl cyclase CyaB